MSFFDRVDRVAIAGVGLIGGSIGLALKRAGFQGKIVGLGRRWSSLKNAINVGAVDSATPDYGEALNNADILIICTPVNVIPEIAERAVEFAGNGCIISDVGSTKGHLIAEIEKIMPEHLHFVGAHPMAGSHRTSVAASKAELFDGSICIITPTKATSHDALGMVSELWKIIGARVEIMSPQDHDFLIAAASHLPHAVACALVQVVSGIENEHRKALDYTATGFADTTRIASGDPEIWSGIFLQNADMVSSMLEQLERELADIRMILENGDAEAIMKKLKQAKRIRDSISD